MGIPHFRNESNIILEILDEDDQPCPIGKAGRVVVTDLHNFATPLIRYAVGDYAMFGAPCPSGRGLPVIQRIMGRQRNMMVLPDGDRIWPRFNSDDLSQFAPVRQVQIIQTDIGQLRANIVVTRPPSTEEEEALKAAISENLPGQPQVTLNIVESIPIGSNGKFEDFKSELVQARS